MSLRVYTFCFNRQMCLLISGKDRERSLPEAFATAEARSLMGKLINGGLLDGHWQPAGLSNAEKGVLAQYLAGELNVKNQWQTFAALWGMKPETLRRAAAKAMEQKKSLVFQDRLKGLLR